MGPAWLDGAMASRTRRLDTGAAARAECVTGLYAGAALGTVREQRLPQDEVENDADAVEQEDGQQGPHHVAHAAAAGIAVDIADQQSVAGQEQRRHDGEQKLQPQGAVSQENKTERDKARQEHDTGGNPTTKGDHSLAGHDGCQNGRHTILLSRRRREASTSAEAVPKTEEITAHRSHARAAESPNRMRSVWPISRMKAQAKMAAAPAKTAPWRRSTSAATSELVRRSRSASGSGQGSAESPAASAA